jgi:arsenate reductase
MAEAILKRTCNEEFEVRSPGLEPGEFNPLVVEAMQEIGVDFSRDRTGPVFDFVKSGRECERIRSASVAKAL